MSCALPLCRLYMAAWSGTSSSVCGFDVIRPALLLSSQPHAAMAGSRAAPCRPGWQGCGGTLFCHTPILASMMLVHGATWPHPQCMHRCRPVSWAGCVTEGVELALLLS